MSRLNQIEKALMEVEAGVFQKICDAYLSKKEKQRITSLGSQDGANSTTKGTPDSYFIGPNGEFVFIEYTIQKKGLVKKIKDDIKKCFDEKITKIPKEKIKRIIYCHINKLKVNQLNDITYFCNEQKCIYDDINISSLSFELAFTYPQIAYDLLGIEIDSGQILSTREFIKRSSRKITLENEFFYREDELAEILSSINENEITIIVGKAGTGKTKIALEALKIYSEMNPEYNVFCIENRGAPIYNEINLLNDNDSKTLLLIDDGNRLRQLDYIVSEINNNTERKILKLIITVRDYAIKGIESLVEVYRHKQVTINPFSRVQIAKIISSKSINIRNPVAIDRVCDVSKGNPRLAIMASDVVLKSGSIDSILNVYSIYSHYFNELTDIISDNKRLSIVLGVISYFTFLDKNNIPTNLYKNIGISENEFWESIVQLYSNELVDLYENQICKISDQVLSIFSFYKTVFIDKDVKFEIFLNNYFIPNYPNRMLESIVSIAQTFDFELVKRETISDVKKYWDKLWCTREYDNLFVFANTFWFIVPNEVLNYLNTFINNIESVEAKIDFSGNMHGVTETIFSLLRKYAGMNMDEIRISIQIACNYFIKRSDLAHEFSEYLLKSFEFDKAFSIYTSEKQLLLFNVLINEAKTSKIIEEAILFIAPKYLKMDHENIYSEGMSFTITHFQIGFYKHIELLHKVILEYVEKLSLVRIKEFISSYSQIFSYNQCTNIEELRKALLFDFSYISKMMRLFDWTIFGYCKVANDYFEVLAKNMIDNDEIQELKREATNNAYKVYLLLDFNPYERTLLRNEGLTYEEIERKQSEDIAVALEEYNLKDYILLFTYIAEIIPEISEHDIWRFKNSMHKIFENMINRQRLFIESIEYLVKTGNCIKYEIYGILNIYFGKYGDRDYRLYKIINDNDFIYKNIWRYNYFASLPEKMINEYYINELILFMSTVKITWNISYDFLIRYENCQPGITKHIVKILLANIETNNCSFSLLFNPYSDINKKITEYFRNSMELLEDVWLHEIFKDSSCDLNGDVLAVILNENNMFIKKFRISTKSK